MSNNETASQSHSDSLNQAVQADPTESYPVKWIEFNHERLPILLQNLNGPCPLLALANILFLRKTITCRPDAISVTTDRLINAIANKILTLDTSKLSPERRANFEYNIEDVLAVLPKLKTGLDVNLKFTGIDKFEYTREFVLFDLFDIPIYHGWVIDPQNTRLQEIIQTSGTSYNQLIEKMLEQKQSNDNKLVQESLLIEQFFDENQSQLTHYGILQLNETMKENQLAIFFRNNHFSTIWKHNNRILLLVSDQGYIDHSTIVFETLTDVDNDSAFTDGYGQTWRKPRPPENTSRDQELAAAIYNQERQKYQMQQQRAYHENSKKKHRKPSHHDDSCILS